MTPVTAKWWTPKEGKILCELCPRYCKIGEGKAGFCYIRYNENGTLKTKGFSHTTGFALDPIEKKPLFHVHPSKKILSFGTAGCNMGCMFCQNWDISKARDDERMSGSISTESIIERASDLKEDHNNIGLAFTYNEPTIWGEWVMELAAQAEENGLISVMVTNGYITHQAVKDIYPLIDAANIDLKSFDDNFYYKVTLSHIQPVLDAILWIKNEGTWIELTNLIIPGKNDSPEEIKDLCRWVYYYCGEDTPLHFTAFHPDYKMLDAPPTPFSTLQMAYDVAKDIGLNYVYTGNAADDETASTYCPSCSETLVRRSWYDIRITGLDGNKCSSCGYEIKGIF